jgi:hypothetical protein
MKQLGCVEIHGIYKKFKQTLTSKSRKKHAGSPEGGLTHPLRKLIFPIYV